MIGMGQNFFQRFTESSEIFLRASEALEIDMARLCFTANDLLNQTEYTQPAILTVEIAILAALQERCGLVPTYFAGHSLGEYAALVAADVLRFEDALKLVKRRGFLMQCAVADGKGAMAAIILDGIAEIDVEVLIENSGAEIANFNSRDQIVISGMKQDVTLACEELTRRWTDVRIVPLTVSAPFHSRHMESCESTFRDYLETFQGSIDYSNVDRVLSNYSGCFHTTPGLIPSLVTQISAPVRWLDNMRNLSLKTDTIFEVGPQRVLSKFFPSIGATCKAVVDARSLERNFEVTHAQGI